MPYLYVFWWFQQLISKAACVLYTETLGTHAYQYVLLHVITSIHGLHTSKYIYNHMHIYVCLLVTTSVYKHSRTTFIYVSICSNMQICLTMYHYDVQCTTCIYVLIWQFFHKYVQYTYSVTYIYEPILVYTCYTYKRTNTHHKNMYKHVYKNTYM